MFVANDRFARDFYRQLTGGGNLLDTLAGRPLAAVDARRARGATVLSANGAAAATLDAEQAADAGEVVALGSRYAVGFRARFVTPAGDTLLISGVAATDVDLHALRWVVRPQRARLVGGMMTRTSAGRRYSLRGALMGQGGEPLLLLDEIADVAPRDSRATAVDVASRRVIAAQPLALRCP